MNLFDFINNKKRVYVVLSAVVSALSKIVHKSAISMSVDLITID